MPCDRNPGADAGVRRISQSVPLFPHSSPAKIFDKKKPAGEKKKEKKVLQGSFRYTNKGVFFQMTFNTLSDTGIL